jgi:hypothetical protein
MTLNFRNWPLWRLPAHSLAFTPPGELRLVRPRRPELAGRWRRNSDGKLECRWESMSRPNSAL